MSAAAWTKTPYLTSVHAQQSSFAIGTGPLCDCQNVWRKREQPICTHVWTTWQQQCALPAPRFPWHKLSLLQQVQSSHLFASLAGFSALQALHLPNNFSHFGVLYQPPQLKSAAELASP